MVQGPDELRTVLEAHGIDWLHIRRADGMPVAVIGPGSMDAVEELIGDGTLEGLFVCMDPDGSWRGARRDRDGTVTLVGGVSERIAYRSILGGYRVGTSHRSSKYGSLNPGDGNHRYSPRTDPLPSLFKKNRIRYVSYRFSIIFPGVLLFVYMSCVIHIIYDVCITLS